MSQQLHYIWTYRPKGIAFQGEQSWKGAACTHKCENLVSIICWKDWMQRKDNKSVNSIMSLVTGWSTGTCMTMSLQQIPISSSPGTASDCYNASRHRNYIYLKYCIHQIQSHEASDKKCCKSLTQKVYEYFICTEYFCIVCLRIVCVISPLLTKLLM